MTNPVVPSITLSTRITSDRLEPYAEVTQEMTTEHPAMLLLGFKNSGNQPLEISTGAPMPFSPPNSTAGPEPLHIIPPEYETGLSFPNSPGLIPQTLSDGCWSIKDDYRRYSMLMGNVFKPGESVREQYVLLQGTRSENCFPAGQYSFESTIRYQSPRTSENEAVFDRVHSLEGTPTWTLELTLGY